MGYKTERLTFLGGIIRPGSEGMISAVYWHPFVNLKTKLHILKIANKAFALFIIIIIYIHGSKKRFDVAHIDFIYFFAVQTIYATYEIGAFLYLIHNFSLLLWSIAISISRGTGFIAKSAW